eukprot:g22685.t3
MARWNLHFSRVGLGAKGRCARFFAKGPDQPQVQAAGLSQPRWAAGWHDMLQYHFFFEDMFVQARVFLTPSVEEHSLWIFDHSTQKVVELENCKERMKQSEESHLEILGPRLQIFDGPGGGRITHKDTFHICPDISIEFKNKNVFSWLPAGQSADAVIHRPDLELSMTYGGQKRQGRGYSKRYFGHYGPHWGYRFIQSSWLGGDKFLTADATFRLGEGEAKYNYFKLLDGNSGELIQADSRDTYQQQLDLINFGMFCMFTFVGSTYPMKDDWGVQPFPVDYDSDWAQGRTQWEVYLDAYDAWIRETSRLIEVEDMDYEESREVYQGKYPDAPEYPSLHAKVLQAAAEPDVVALADALEEAESDPNCKDCALWTPLMYAAMAGSLECTWLMQVLS